MQTSHAFKRPVDRPMPGFVLSLLGGLFITASGVYNLQYNYYPYMGYAPYQPYGLLGIVSGAGVLLGSLLLYWVPRQRVGWGVMVLIFAVTGLFSAFGTAFLLTLPGIALALVGGSLAIVWRSSSSLRVAVASSIFSTAANSRTSRRLAGWPVTKSASRLRITSAWAKRYCASTAWPKARVLKAERAIGRLAWSF